MKKAIYWFRNDLRLHDQRQLKHIAQHVDELIPFYCFDTRFYTTHPLGFPKTNSFRTHFLIESVYQLKNNLNRLGSNLIITIGNTAELITKIVKEFKIDTIYAHREYSHDEMSIENEIKDQSEIPLVLHSPNSIFEIEDLPFRLEHLPDIFTQFRKQVESSLDAVSVVPEISSLPPCSFDDQSTKKLSPETFNLSITRQDPRAFIIFKGGETEGLSRLQNYIWEKQRIKTYKETRNGMLGEAYSSKFSPWLANGSLSVKKIITEINRFEEEIVRNQSTYWLKFELLWREYFRLVGAKYGNKIFKKQGIKNTPIQYKNNKTIFYKWTKGETGNRFVDANMKELLYTGFMSNRGRQNAASYFCKDLQIDWRWGAAWFESLLIDYDVYSNWGNWMYIAGVGNDPRENRYFNTKKQAEIYDPDKRYRNYWLSNQT